MDAHESPLTLFDTLMVDSVGMRRSSRLVTSKNAMIRRCGRNVVTPTPTLISLGLLANRSVISRRIRPRDPRFCSIDGARSHASDSSHSHPPSADRTTTPTPTTLLDPVVEKS